MYSVVPDIDRALIRVSLKGFWDSATAIHYVQELSAAVDSIVERSVTFDLLVDMTGALPFSQDVAAIVGDVITELRGRGLQKAAHISPNPLAQIQIKRISHRHESSRFFSDHVAALQWLSQDDSKFHA